GGDGFREVAVGATFQRGGPVLRGDQAGGNVKDGDEGGRRLVLDLPADLHPVHVGKADVEDDQVGILLRPQQRLAAGGGGIDGKPRAGQDAVPGIALDLVVVD